MHPLSLIGKKFLLTLASVLYGRVISISICSPRCPKEISTNFPQFLSISNSRQHYFLSCLALPPKQNCLNVWRFRGKLLTLQAINLFWILIMGTMTSKMKEMQTRRIAYQTQKTKEYMDRVASYLSAADQEILYSGNGFVEVPEEERIRERIDVYPYLIP